MAHLLLGLDFGGSSIKGAVVDVETGELHGEIASVPTPQPSTPSSVVEAMRTLVDQLPSTGPVGVGYPGVVTRGRTRTAANVDDSWIGADAAGIIERALGRHVVLLNDADAAGLAEMTWGAGAGQDGLVMMLTFGTGIGSALFNDGSLVPNTELGHVEMGGVDAEHWASARVRTELNLDWSAWIARVNDYLDYMHRLFWPDVFILGGAVSARYGEFASLLRAPAEIRPAQFAGQAGIIGAALAAARFA
jgi:polyphosphate glucokinase